MTCETAQIKSFCAIGKERQYPAAKSGMTDGKAWQKLAKLRKTWMAKNGKRGDASMVSHVIRCSAPMKPKKVSVCSGAGPKKTVETIGSRNRNSPMKTEESMRNRKGLQ
ncbi:hypothetical protein JS530_09860 [Bifidobacterium sp. LC6]|uniref:Uncharacterized protein n=1 Tax=Bifidobacterium colobi TaxID=2809026 RepID=A0ABS5UXH4_9BIFI|nr:hypothetical protein [Bifidobacterium colobi]MBT1175797.1 hypothetical protein [Bifidobacterium colobi]